MTAAIAIPVTATPAASALKGMVASGAEQAQTAGEGFAEALAALLNGTPQPQVTHTSKAQLAKTETSTATETPADQNAAAVLPAVPNLILADAKTSAAQATATAQINAQAAQTSAVQVLQAAIKGEPTTAANDETTPAQPQTATPAAPAAALAALAANAQQQTQAAPATAKTPVKAAPKEAANKPQLETASTNSTTPTTESKAAANSHFVNAIEHALSNNSNGNSQNGSANSNQTSSQLPVTASVAIHTTMVDTTAATAPAATAQAQVAVPLDALAVHIARKFEGGENRFEIRLDPIELGKLDISMSVDHDGRVSAVVRAERPETLDMLQRDARLLESQLRQSGLNVDSNSLSFSLGNGNNQRSAFAGAGQSFANAVEGQPEAQAATATTTTIVNVRDGVDIRI